MERGPRNGTLVVLPLDQRLEHGPKLFAILREQLSDRDAAEAARRTG